MIERYSIIGIIFSVVIIAINLYLIRRQKISGGTFTLWLIIGIAIGLISLIPTFFILLSVIFGTDFLISAVTATSFMSLLLLIFYIDYKVNELRDKLMKLTAKVSAYDFALNFGNEVKMNGGDVDEHSRFKDWKYPEFDERGMTKWNWMCQYRENLKLGKYTDIGAFTYINAKYGVEIQDYVQIGSHCSIYSWSTIDNKKGKVTIKRNARIGSHSVIMPGVTIGENSIVGAFSFVNKDIPDNVVAFGIPVKIVKKLK